MLHIFVVVVARVRVRVYACSVSFLFHSFFSVNEKPFLLCNQYIRKKTIEHATHKFRTQLKWEWIWNLQKKNENKTKYKFQQKKSSIHMDTIYIYSHEHTFRSTSLSIDFYLFKIGAFEKHGKERVYDTHTDALLKSQNKTHSPRESLMNNSIHCYLRDHNSLCVCVCVLFNRR